VGVAAAAGSARSRQRRPGGVGIPTAKPLECQRRVEPGSPLGRSIEALAVRLRCAQAIGLERPRAVMGEVFGPSISEGATSNILARAQAPLVAAAAAVAAQASASAVVASDETSVRVAGRTWWDRVLVTSVRVPRVIRPSRGAAVVRAPFGARRPRAWVSDSFGSQRGHADRWQVCLAHLLRDAQRAIDCGDADFPAASKRLLPRAVAIGRRRDRPRDTTPERCRADLDRRLDRVLALPRCGEAADRLRRRTARDREHLFVFVTDRDVPATNNASGRAAAQRDLPQGDQRVPLAMGCGHLRRFPLRRQHRQSQRPLRAPRPPSGDGSNLTRHGRNPTRVSNYAAVNRKVAWGGSPKSVATPRVQRIAGVRAVLLRV